MSLPEDYVHLCIPLLLAGLLLLNRSVYKGASIMTDPSDIPEQHCVELSAPVPDMLMNLKPLKQQITACQTHSSTVAADGGSLLLTPDMHKLYELLKQSGQKQSVQQQQNRDAISVAAVMAQAISKCLTSLHGINHTYSSLCSETVCLCCSK